MKESDYCAAQIVTRLRIAVEVLREPALGTLSKEDRRKYFQAIEDLSVLRDKLWMSLPVEEGEP